MFPTQIEELVLKVPELAPYYMINVSRTDNMDKMDVSVELNERAENSDQVKSHLARQLRDMIKTFVGVSTTVIVNPSGTLERSAGKAKHVTDLRKLR